jgi:hypothetical protein
LALNALFGLLPCVACYASHGVYGQSKLARYNILSIHITIPDVQSIVAGTALLVAGGFLGGVGERLSAWLLDEVKRRWRR